MSKYKEIDELKEKIDELNILLEKVQNLNFILKLNITNNYSNENNINVLQLQFQEAIYSERITF